MEKIATTFRLDPEVKARLSRLSELQQATLNKLANRALREFIDREARVVEADLLATVAELRSYRAQDPGFEAAIARMAEAEASGAPDPAEGAPVVEQGTTALVRDMLGG
ncbi:MAG: hypothetical protein AAFY59_04535 [Pseudomonadota bacterium]